MQTYYFPYMSISRQVNLIFTDRHRVNVYKLSTWVSWRHRGRDKHCKKTTPGGQISLVVWSLPDCGN